MKSLTYFRCSLFTPVLLPLFASSFGGTSGIAFLLVMSLAFGGVPYALLATFLWVRLGRTQTAHGYIRLALLAPLLFAPLQCAGWAVWSMLDTATPNTPGNVLAPMVPLAGYALLFGYAYVAVVCSVYFLLRRIRVISEPLATAAGECVENAA